MTTFFTSDTHFSHKNILSYCCRPFENLEEMEWKLIENWNRKVKPGDLVYHLGDFFLGKDPEKAIQILNRLNGQIFLIKGNHDYPKVLAKYEHLLVKVEKIHKVKVKDPDAACGRQLIVLCHYPMVTWDQAHYGAWHFHGHCHGSLKSKDKGMRLDVGVDTHNYEPMSYEELKPIMKKLEFEQVDHHALRDSSNT